MVVDDGENPDVDHYYAYDHLYSPAALIADDGTIEERYEYDAYGKLTRLDPDFTTWSADAYIVKSSDLSELKKTIKQVLGET